MALTARLKNARSVFQFPVSSFEGWEYRTILSNICIALALTIQFTDPALGPLAGFAFGILFLGVVIRPGQHSASKLVYVGVAVIVASALIALPISAFAGTLAPTIILAAATVANCFYFLAAPDSRIWHYVIPLWLTHGAIVIYQWFTSDLSRVTGLTPNANATATMMLLGAVWFIHHPRLKWVAPPLLAAIPFTGSRWTTVVAIMVVVGIFAFRKVPVRWLFPGIAVLVGLVVVLNFSALAGGYRLAGNQGLIEEIGAQAATDTLYRFDLQNIFSRNVLIPSGFVDSNMHNLILRMAVETGLLSALAWIALTAWTLWKADVNKTAFWMMACLGLLSIMYYHIWLGANGAIWWMLLSIVHRYRPEIGGRLAEIVEIPEANHWHRH